jgi:hypothetical protein
MIRFRESGYVRGQLFLAPKVRPQGLTPLGENGSVRGRSYQQNFQDQHIISIYQPYVLTMTRSRQYYRRLSTKSGKCTRHLRHFGHGCHLCRQCDGRSRRCTLECDHVTLLPSYAFTRRHASSCATIVSHRHTSHIIPLVILSHASCIDTHITSSHLSPCPTCHTVTRLLY